MRSVWVVLYDHPSWTDTDDRDDREPAEVLFTGQRAALAFGREATRRGYRVIVPPWKRPVFGSGRLAVKVDLDR